MDVLYRSAAPRYKGCTPRPAPCGGGILAGFRTTLLGGGAPVYKGASGAASAAPAASSSWWQGLSVQPQYRAAPPAGCPMKAAERQAGGCAESGAEIVTCEEALVCDAGSEIHIW